MTHEINSLLPEKSDEPTIEASDSPVNLTSILQKPYVDDDLSVALRTANVILLPQEGFNDRSDVLSFPKGTEDLFTHLRDAAPPELAVEIAVSDGDYAELALHYDWLILPTIFVSDAAFPIILDLVADWIGRRIFKGDTKAQVRSTYIVADPDGGSREFRYDGPVDAYTAAFTQVMKDESARRKPPK